MSVLLGNGDGTFQTQVTYAVGVRPDPRSWRATSTATAAPTWPSRTIWPDDVSVLLGNGDGTFQTQVTYAVGIDPDSLVAGDFNGDGRTDLAVANYGSNDVSVLLGNGDGTFQTAGDVRGGVRPVLRSWPATSTATAAPTWPSRTRLDGDVSVLLGNGDGTFQAQVTVRGGVRPDRARGGRLQRRRPDRPGRREPGLSRSAAPATCRCCWATATAPSRPR